jgi:hypothetical protein
MNEASAHAARVSMVLNDGYRGGEFYRRDRIVAGAVGCNVGMTGHVYPRLLLTCSSSSSKTTATRRRTSVYSTYYLPKTACDEFLQDKPEQMSILIGVSSLTFGYLLKDGRRQQSARDQPPRHHHKRRCYRPKKS